MLVCVLVCSNYDAKENSKIIALLNNFDDFISEESLWQISETIKPRHSSKHLHQMASPTPDKHWRPTWLGSYVVRNLVAQFAKSAKQLANVSLLTCVMPQRPDPEILKKGEGAEGWIVEFIKRENYQKIVSNKKIVGPVVLYRKCT